MSTSLVPGTVYRTNQGFLLLIQAIEKETVTIEYMGEAREMRAKEGRPNPVQVNLNRAEEVAKQQDWKEVASLGSVTWPDSK